MFSFAQLLGPNHDVSSSSPEINQAKWTTLTVWVLKWSSKRWRSEMDVCSFDPESQTRCYSYTPCFQASNLLAILYMSGIALSSQGQCHDHKTIRNVELLATTCLDPYRALATSSHGYCENPCSKNIQWPWRSDRYRKKSMNWNLWNSAFSMNLSIQAQHVEMLPGSPLTDAVHLWGLTVPLACTRPRLAMQVGVHAVPKKNIHIWLCWMCCIYYDMWWTCLINLQLRQTAVSQISVSCQGICRAADRSNARTWVSWSSKWTPYPWTAANKQSWRYHRIDKTKQNAVNQLLYWSILLPIYIYIIYIYVYMHIYIYTYIYIIYAYIYGICLLCLDSDLLDSKPNTRFLKGTFHVLSRKCEAL